MSKLTLETSKIDGKLYYEILVNGHGISGTHIFENALSEWMRAKDKFAFEKEDVE